MRLLAAGGLLAAVALLGAAPGRTAGTTLKEPEGKAGPYRVVIDRLSHSLGLGINYQTGLGKRDAGSVESRRTLQMQLAAYAPDSRVAAGLATFQVSSVTVDLAGRTAEVPHYGGILESPNDNAVIRAYLYVPNLPLAAREIRSVEGQIVAYDHSEVVDLEIPLEGRKPPVSVEKDGVKATLREMNAEGGGAQLVLWVETAPDGVLLPTSNDGTYGVTLSSADRRSAIPSGGSVVQPRANQAEYRVAFHSLRGPAGSVRVKILSRGGGRHTYPFKIDHVPIPTRAGSRQAG